MFSDSPSASTNLGVVTPDNAPASHNQSECDESVADNAEPTDLETNPSSSEEVVVRTDPPDRPAPVTSRYERQLRSARRSDYDYY